MTIEIGSTVEGVIVKLFDYGAIVRLHGGKMGLVHISEVADTYVRDVHEYFKEDDRVYVKVLKLNDKGRYELSTKKADPSAVNAPKKSPPPEKKREFQSRELDSERRKEKAPVTFEDKLSRFLKDSEERLVDLKRNIESKRGSRKK